MTGHRGRHRSYTKGRVGIVSGALIIIAGLVIAVGLRTATHLLSPAALAATAPVTAPGTDVSNLTTVSSWPDVKSAGMTFVGILAVDGTGADPGYKTSYDSHVPGALGQGLFVMPYVVADPLQTKVPTGTQQFANAWSVISSVTSTPYAPGGQYLPIALDMEAQPTVTSDACYGLSQTQMKTWISQFMVAAAAQTHVTPVIYSNPNWWQTCIGSTNPFGANPLWIANYGVSTPTIPAGWPGYTFWQSSNSATLTGISGAADLDQMAGAPAVVTGAVGGSGTVVLHTLNSLAGQTVTYSAATALPTGASLASDGVFRWSSSTPVGSYAITATPSATAAVIPAAVSFALHVHGTITVSAVNRSSVAGTPIWFRVATSGPDQNVGATPTLKATGLPSGLAMSSAGVITGWPSRPGSYQVAVTASDALGGTGSASFTWTVTAAANSGTAGPVRQLGGSGKCLDDPGSKTANGTVIDLSTCTGKSNQSWTTVQDGTLRVLGKCLGVVGDSKSSGARLQLVSCNSGDGGQLWQAATDSQLLNPQSGKCIDVPVASAANGTKPVIEPCANSTSQPNEHWLRPAAPVVSGVPGKCLAVSGSPVVVAGCANTASQHWQLQPDGTIRLAGKCLTEGGTTSGSILWIGTCSGSAATKWKLAASGPIAVKLTSAASGLCLTVPSSGRLVIASCANTPAGTWHVE